MLIDKIFLAVVSFCVSFTWLRYYLDDNAVCAVGAVAICALIFIFINALSGGTNKKKLKRRQIKQTENLTALLSFMSDDDTASLLRGIEELKNAQRHKNSLTFEQNGKKIKVVFCFTASPMSPGEFCDIVKNCRADRLDVFACKFDKGVPPLVKMTPVETRLFDIEATYRLLEKHSLLPPSVTNTKKRPAFSSALPAVIFSRARAKYYLMSSLFLLLTGFLTFFRLYYLISGTILFMLFIYARFNTRFNPVIKQKEL